MSDQPRHRVYGRLRFLADRRRWALSGIEPHVAIRVKRMFPRIAQTETTQFLFPASDEMCAELSWFLIRYPMAVEPDDRRRLDNGRIAFEARQNEIDTILLPDWKPGPFTGFINGHSPYPAQIQAIELACRLKRLLLLDSVGMGKTVTALGALIAAKALPAAIVVQAHLATQWKRDFIEKFTSLSAHIVEGRSLYPLPAADLYIFKYSNIAAWVDVAALGKFKAVVFDEIQELRHGDRTNKGQAARVFANCSSLRLGLTGTPVYNFGSEIFPIVDLIEPGSLGNFEEFVREWCKPGNGKWLVENPDALGTYLREQHIILRRTRLGEPVNTIVHEVPYDGKVAAGAEATARMLATRVLTGSFVQRGQAARELDMLARQVTGVAKARSVAAYVRILLEAGEPVLLAGWHREVYDIWRQELGVYRPVMYTGTESPVQKDKAKSAFMNGDSDLMIISLRSGIGLDGLQTRCRTVVFGELDWSPKVHEQVIGRLDRPGQTGQVTAVFLHADGGSDPLVVSLLGLKASQARGITDPMAGVEHIYSDESRLKMLAERYLQKRAEFPREVHT